MNWLGWSALLLGLCASLLACSSKSSNPGAPPCGAGEKDTCVGPNGCAGVRTCDADGQWGACACTAGTGGQAGGGGMDGGGDAATCDDKCGTPSCGTCPTTVKVPVGTFDVDATEVTNEQYAAFLEVGYAKVTLTSCEKDSLVPKQWPFEAGKDEHPVVFVDWCDAYRYCEWAGRRLCGKIGGGANAMSDFKDATKSQWYAACSTGGQNTWPYGNTYEAGTCNTGGSETLPVGSKTTCEGGYTGLFDMSGNVWEWEDSCATYFCRVRGGGFTNTNGECTADVADQPSTTQANDVGIRCCSP